MNLDPAAVPVMPRGTRLHMDRVRGGWVLLAPERAMKLDPIGHAILTEIDGSRSVASIAADLAARFGAPPDQVETDCREFLAPLVARRVLDVAP